MSPVDGAHGAHDPSARDAWVLSAEAGVGAGYGAVDASVEKPWQTVHMAPGWHLGIHQRLGYVSVGVHLRCESLDLLGGAFERASSGTGYTHGSLGPGLRLHPFGGPIAPFLGGGASMQFIQYDPSRTNGYATQPRGATGAGWFAEVGLELFRRSHVGVFVLMRVDIPRFNVQHDLMPNNPRAPSAKGDRYVIPLSLTLGMRFQ